MKTRSPAQNVLDFLKSKDIHATFFVVGSRVIERSQVLIEEYMAGHEISAHTWSHKVFSWPGATDSRYFNQAQLSPLRRSQLHRLLLSWAGLVKLSKKFWMSLLLLCVHPMGILVSCGQYQSFHLFNNCR